MGESRTVPDQEATWRARSGPARTIDRVVQVSSRQVLLRTLVLGLFFCGLLAVPFVLYYRAETGRARDRAVAIEEQVIRLVDQTTSQELTGVLSDLRFLSRQTEMQDFLAEDTRASRAQLAREYLAFAAQKRAYDQIRVIDPEGWERVRVNFDHGAPQIVPDRQLQNKRSRYYFADAMRLGPGEIYVSPLDLNVEQDGLEQPLKPVLRVALPLFDALGDRRGVLVLNYLGKSLLDRIRAIGRAASGQLWLFNSDGYWLIGPGSEDEWGFMYPDRSDRSLAARHPRAWQQMASETEGSVQSDEGWLRFRRVYPLAGEPSSVPAGGLASPSASPGYYWIVAILMPDTALREGNRALAVALLGGYGALAVMSFLVSGGLAFVSVRSRTLGRVMEGIVDNVPTLISYVDAGQRYRFNNRAYTRFWGLSPRAVYGKTIRELLGDAAYAKIVPFVEQALSGQQVSFKMHVDYSRAGERDVEVTYVPDMAAEGEVRGFFAVVNDITRLNQAERREREHVLELAHAGRLASIGEMATQIAHEVNQPVTAITTYCAACLRSLDAGCPGPGHLREWLQAIDAEARRVSDVVRRLREFVRKGEMERSPIDINDVARAVASMVRYDTEAHGIDLDLQLRQDLPRAMADRILVEQVVLNLIKNGMEAVAAMPAGQRRVSVETTASDQQVEVVVTDSGPGVPAEIAGQLFDSFVTTKASGLGMGLPISRSIVEAHGGHLDYANIPGRGTTFRFGLPTAAS